MGEFGVLFIYISDVAVTYTLSIDSLESEQD